MSPREEGVRTAGNALAELDVWMGLTYAERPCKEPEPGLEGGGGGGGGGACTPACGCGRATSGAAVAGRRSRLSGFGMLARCAAAATAAAAATPVLPPECGPALAARRLLLAAADSSYALLAWRAADILKRSSECLRPHSLSSFRSIAASSMVVRTLRVLPSGAAVLGRCNGPCGLSPTCGELTRRFPSGSWSRSGLASRELPPPPLGSDGAEVLL